MAARYSPAQPSTIQQESVPDNSMGPLFEDGPTKGTMILLMGQVGAGKSHFINSAAERNIVPARHGLMAEEDIRVQSFTVDNPNVTEVGHSRSKVILVETPGLKNGRVNDIEIVRRIGAWLNDYCDGESLVAGIIFLHDITEDRATVHSDTRAWPIKWLESQALFQHFILTTGKWDTDVVKRDQKRYVDREQDLKGTRSWRILLNIGVSLSRYEGNHDTAWEAINRLLKMSPLRAGFVRKEFNWLHTTLPKVDRPKAPALMRLARVFSELTLNFESITFTRAVDEEGKRKVTVLAAGYLEILSGAQAGSGHPD